MISGGIELDWLRPLDPDEVRKDGDGVRMAGTHVAHYQALNVRDPVPGMHYYWCRKKTGDLIRFRNMGWEVVPPGSQSYAGDITDPNQGLVDGASPAQHDVVLVQIHESKLAAIQQEKMEEARLAREGSLAMFMERATETELRYGRRGGLRYVSDDHRTETEVL